MHDLKWSHAEKRLSRRLFDTALKAELAEVIAEFKAKAASVESLEEMWAIREFLSRKQREIDEKYVYRYSRLLFIFVRLVREGRLQEAELRGLSEEKRAYIQRMLSL